MSNDLKNTFLAFILGGVFGSIFGLLCAPKSGNETRNDVKKLGGEIVSAINKLKQDLKKTEDKIHKKDICIEQKK
ncbi:MAG: YtxH domain-containing protein [Endomicrobium sp.]|jgi:gas vesicle protein|nr:YtxH domain-containing protein [Endomicrobium sp.]